MILVLGAGLLGSWIHFRYPKDTLLFSHKDFDATDTNSLLDVIEDNEPDAVINCVGITPRHPDKFMMRPINSAFPHRLASMCDLIGAKLVTISTDCVFTGFRGQYDEEDTPDADDDYGLSKCKGEVTYGPHLTIRCSFVGFPDPNKRGLLSWFYANKGGTVDGFSKVYWNGLCVTVLTDLLVELAYSRSSGLLHVFGETVTKSELLQYVNHVYDLDVIIRDSDIPIRDKTLASVRKDKPEAGTGLLDQLLEMKQWEKEYTKYLQTLV